MKDERFITYCLIFLMTIFVGSLIIRACEERRIIDERETKEESELLGEMESVSEVVVEKRTASNADASKSMVKQSEPDEEEGSQESESETDPEVRIIVSGKELDPEIGRYLREKLQEAGIEWWERYAVAQMFQESGFDPFAENRNGLDKGILQYRITYWSETDGDIFDYKAQIDRYVRETAYRISIGCTIEETISRHNTSDYGSFNPDYVSQVSQWIEKE